MDKNKRIDKMLFKLEARGKGKVDLIRKRMQELILQVYERIPEEWREQLADGAINLDEFYYLINHELELTKEEASELTRLRDELERLNATLLSKTQLEILNSIPEKRKVEIICGRYASIKDRIVELEEN